MPKPAADGGRRCPAPERSPPRNGRCRRSVIDRRQRRPVAPHRVIGRQSTTLEGFMKRLWVAVGVADGVAIFGIVAIWVLANPNRYRASIQTQLEKQLGRKVSLGEMSLGLLPLRFQVSNPVVAEDPLIRPQPDFI